MLKNFADDLLSPARYADMIIQYSYAMQNTIAIKFAEQKEKSRLGSALAYNLSISIVIALNLLLLDDGAVQAAA